jgi:hypothetical protein
MQKRTLYTFLLFLLGLNSCTKRADQITQLPNGDLVLKSTINAVPTGIPLDKKQLDHVMINTLETHNDFRWDMVDLKTIWSALQYGDHSVAIGYKPAGEGDISSTLSNIRVNTGAYKQVHDALVAQVLKQLNSTSSTPVTLQDILVEDDPVLPILTLRITDKTVLTNLYNLVNVRYLEPLDYWPDVPRSSSGCSAATEPLNPADWTTVTPLALMPWNYNNHNIPLAWTNSQGAGVTIGLIDAGLSSSQNLLSTQFNNGESNVGRTISTAYTLGTSAYTSCTHGTSMAGLAVGPKNSLGAVTGVAYKSNFYFIRSSDDVVLDASSEITATKNAFKMMGNTPSVKIISISMGTPFSSSVLKDGVDYAYGLGKLIFAAAGTSFTWTSWWGVIYPAAYNSCVAVTGVRENGSTCGTCHDGSQVLYTITMERNSNNNRNSLSIPASGVTSTYIGGSSCATATTAGIASLVWSTRPNMTRAQVLNCLTNTAQFYPSKSSSQGYGNLNAYSAVNFAIVNY